jgi:2-iminobutanoate/2-iminopropanoate deaminase
MQSIVTEKAAQPLGHYSQAIEHNGLIFVSGQLPIDPKNPSAPIGDIAEQTKIALTNLSEILNAAGSDLSHVLKTTIFISDITLWAEANRVYAEIFGDHKPARSAVPTRDLPRGFHIEIEAVAIKK